MSGTFPRQHLRSPWPPLLAACLLLGASSACHDGSSDQIDTDLDGDGFTAAEGDCNDGDATIHPQARELCNGIDDNCDGRQDEGIDSATYYVDLDQDGFGDVSRAYHLCEAQEGLVPVAGDCDDYDAQVHPGVVETFDGIDNDCNGLIDDLAAEIWYRDADRDGFGTALDTVTEARDGYVQSRGDCDDTRADVHPGANDPFNDGIDQDCGGTTGPEPHVGLSSTSEAHIQAAINAAAPYTTVWVGPGTYKETAVHFDGKPLTLASTHFAAQTTIDANTAGPALFFQSGEQNGTVVDGFTLLGAASSAPGAVQILDASPSLRSLRITRNNTSAISIQGGSPLLVGLDVQLNFGDSGAGVNANGANVTIVSSSFVRNRAAGNGGGLDVVGGTLNLLNSFFDGNLADTGGAVTTYQSTVSIDGTIFSHNLATYLGGGVYFNSSAVTLSSSRFEKDGSFFFGGALCSDYGQLEMSNVDLLENYGYYSGGLELWFSDSSLSNVQVLGNLGVIDGGGFRIIGGHTSIDQTNVVGNISTMDGGGIYVYFSALGDTLKVDSSILAYNAASAIYVDRYDAAAAVGPALTHSLAFNPESALSNEALPQDTNVFEEPRFVGFSPNRNPYDDDLHLRPDSPAWNAGNPASRDSDGSVADMGAFAGPRGDHAYYLDQDKDGMYDGWERARGLDPEVADDQEDPDGDGLSNGEELANGCDPLWGDTDRDGLKDGDEVKGGGNPIDWFGRLGGARAPGRVPQDFPTIQIAVDAIQTSGELEIEAGVYEETLDIALKEVTLRGHSLEDTTIQGPMEGGVVVAVGAKLTLEDLSVTGGFYSKDSEEEFANGAGVSLSNVDAHFTRVSLHDNIAVNGGGAGMWRSTAVVEDSVIKDNQSQGNGGGITGYFSSLTVNDSVVSGNVTGNYGGGLYGYNGKLTVSGTELFGNSAYFGGGLSSYENETSASDLDVHDNTGYVAGGVGISGGKTFLEASEVSHNKAAGAGGVEIDYSTATVEGVSIHDNTATDYTGGMNAYSNTSLTVTGCAITNNHGGQSGGLVVGNSTVHFTNVWSGNNTGDVEAGGMWLDNSTGDMTAIQVTGNTSGKGHGALELTYTTPKLGGLVVANNSSVGILLDHEALPSVLNSILAYNPDGNLLVGANQTGKTLSFTYSDLYNPAGQPNYTVTTPDSSNRYVEPRFLRYDGAGLPIDFHLAKGSPLVDTGAPGVPDKDGTRSDPGLYGGPLGPEWDRDMDETRDYYWPGERADAPKGENEEAYDANDYDSTAQ